MKWLITRHWETSIDSVYYRTGLLFSSFNKACPFIVDAYTEHSPGILKAQPLQRGGTALDKAICQTVINAAGFTKVKAIQNVRLHTYMGDGRVTLVMENKVKTFKLQVLCSLSVLFLVPIYQNDPFIASCSSLLLNLLKLMYSFGKL